MINNKKIGLSLQKMSKVTIRNKLIKETKMN